MRPQPNTSFHNVSFHLTLKACKNRLFLFFNFYFVSFYTVLHLVYGGKNGGIYYFKWLQNIFLIK